MKKCIDIERSKSNKEFTSGTHEPKKVTDLPNDTNSYVTALFDIFLFCPREELFRNAAIFKKYRGATELRGSFLFYNDLHTLLFDLFLICPREELFKNAAIFKTYRGATVLRGSFLFYNNLQ